MGLEAVVSRELNDLGYDNRITGLGRISFEADEPGICQANLWLRSAGRVQIVVDRFVATDFDVLYERTVAADWDRWIPKDGRIHVKGRSVRSQLSSVPACQRTVKKAIVEQMMKAHRTSVLSESGPTFTVEISIVKDEAVLSIDTTGPGLHRRGYRTLVGEAPLRETLAAGLVQLSFWKPERPFVDPFCGSGTIPIEAAMIGLNMAPGLNRTFEAESWPSFPKMHWENAREQARAMARHELPERLIATDISEDTLSLARYHAKKAGVEEHIHFQRQDFADMTSKRQYGCVITNPPYGLRMGETPEVEAIYASMPNVFRQLKTWSFFVISAYPDFEQIIGQQASRRRKLYNSRLECTYYQFHGPRIPRGDWNDLSSQDRSDEKPAKDVVKPEEKESVGVVADSSQLEEHPPQHEAAPSRPDETVVETTEQSVDVSDSELTKDSIKPEDKVPPCDVAGSSQPEEHPPRHEAAPSQSEEPVVETVDQPEVKQPERPRKQEDTGPVQAFGGIGMKANDQAAIFANRLKKNARHMRRWPTRRDISCFRLYDRDIPEVPLVVDRYDTYLHMAEYDRPHERTMAQHADWLDLMARTASEVLEIPRKNVFMKQRRRQRDEDQYQQVADKSQTAVVREGGLSFEINLSDYLDTGLFLDHRVTRSMVRDEAQDRRVLNLFAYTGSFSVYAIDGGAKSSVTVDLSGTYLRWARRNYELNGITSPEHQLVQADAFDFVRMLPDEQLFDLAVIDPPTFSNSKRTDDVWDVSRDYIELLNGVIPCMAPGGIIYFSTNFRRFKYDESAVPGVSVRDISKRTVPEDFRNKRIHQCWRLVRE